MSVLAIIQARTGSFRFPRKIFQPVTDRGVSVLARVVYEVAEAEGIDQIVVAVPFADFDDVRAHLRGCPAVVVTATSARECDVLGRFASVVRMLPHDVVMRVTGDCPAWSPIIGSRVLTVFHATRPDIATNDTTCSGYPDGTDVEVFSRVALLKADRMATDPHDREHVTPWIRRECRHLIVSREARWVGPKLSIDCPDDLEVVKTWLRHHRSPIC